MYVDRSEICGVCRVCPFFRATDKYLSKIHVIHLPRDRDTAASTTAQSVIMLRGHILRRTPKPLPASLIRSWNTRILHNTAPLRQSPVATVNRDYIKHHSQVKNPRETFNFVDNQFQKSKTSRWIDLHDPATQNLVTRVPETTTEEMSGAVDSAEKAFKSWKNTSLLSRQQIMFRLATLIRENMDRLAASITLEQVPILIPHQD